MVSIDLFSNINKLSFHFNLHKLLALIMSIFTVMNAEKNSQARSHVTYPHTHHAYCFVSKGT